MGAAGKEYILMDDASIIAANPTHLLSKPGVLFMWATCPRLDFAVDVGRKWGLHYRGVAFVWIKTTKAGIPFEATGVRPSITKPLIELVLAFSTEPKGRPLPLDSEAVTQTVFVPEEPSPVFCPREGHSVKPDEVQRRIDALYPQARKLEMYARRMYPGWSSHGNELPVI